MTITVGALDLLEADDTVGDVCACAGDVSVTAMTDRATIEIPLTSVVLALARFTDNPRFKRTGVALSTQIH